jgi:hypothetical protein
MLLHDLRYGAKTLVDLGLAAAWFSRKCSTILRSTLGGSSH